MSDAVVVAIATSVSSLVATLVLLYREGRNRRWQIEDAERTRQFRVGLAQHMEDTSQELKRNTDVSEDAATKAATAVEHAQTAAAKVDRATEHLSQQIAETKEMNKIALDTANGFTGKIAEQAERLAEAMRMFTGTQPPSTLEQVDATTRDTNERIRHMEADDDPA